MTTGARGGTSVAITAFVAATLLAAGLVWVGWDIAEMILGPKDQEKVASNGGSPEETMAGTWETTSGDTVSGTWETTTGGAASEADNESSSGWIVVATAFIAAVAPFVIWGGRLANGSAGAGSSGTPIPEGDSESPAGSAAAATTATYRTSFASREPAVSTAAIAAILQVFILLGLPVSSGEEAALVGGLTALAGLFIRGRVKPYKT